jgi:hypothetical protein
VTNETDKINEIDRLMHALALQNKKLEECLTHLEELVNQLRKDSIMEDNEPRFSLAKSLFTNQNHFVLRNKTYR